MHSFVDLLKTRSESGAEGPLPVGSPPWSTVDVHMIHRPLLNVVHRAKWHIAWALLFQWLGLLANAAMMYVLAQSLGTLIQGSGTWGLLPALLLAGLAILLRILSSIAAQTQSQAAAEAAKRSLRSLLYQKVLGLGSAYRDQVQTSELVQLFVEGVDQLEVYFGSYLPQFFYAFLAPLTLFFLLSPFSLLCAAVLLLMVPLIPLSIALVQRWAKRLFKTYWGQYSSLGDSFLENLQGLSTLKIYQADAYKQEQMEAEAEDFRRATMRVLSMQLNSISVMDLVTYGGTALGLILALQQFGAGRISVQACLLIMLLAAEFFTPMRQLGSLFHVAMNGLTAGDRILRLLGVAERERGRADFPAPEEAELRCQDLHFAYNEEREILHGLDLRFRPGSFTALVGESGSGKSTLASILMGRSRDYRGQVWLGQVELRDLDEAALFHNITYVSHQSYLFKGSLRENLRMARPDAEDGQLWSVLDRVKLGDFFRAEGGLDTPLLEQASNLSGGQRQRLALARALLHDSPIYIFDEASSNIDAESEAAILEEIQHLARSKTVIMIAHRLAAAAQAEKIYVLAAGRLIEEGSHAELLAQGGRYAQLWRTQEALENYGKEGQI